MSKKKELFKNTLIIFVGKISTNFIVFLLLPIYTYFLSTNEYGVFDLTITYIILFAPVISFQLESSIFRFLIDSRNNIDDQKKYVTNTLITTLISVFIIILLCFMLNLFINIKYLYYVLGMLVAVIFSNILLQIARGLGKNVLYSKASIITGITNVISTIVFLVIYNYGIIGLFIANIFSNILCILYLCIKLDIIKLIDLNLYDKKITSELLHYSLPLIPNGIMWWIINVSDRTLISIFMGTSYNGIYAVSTKFSSAFISIYNIFNLSWQESAALYVNDKERNEYFTSTFNQIILSFLSIVLLLISCMSFVFKILINNNYSDAYMYIPILLVASLFNVLTSFIGGIYLAKKLTKEVAKTSLYSAIINFVINIILIKYIGLYAACLSTLISFMMMTIYRYIDVQKYVKLQIYLKTVLITIISLVFSITLYYVNNLYLNILNIIIALILTLFINKNVINVIKNSFIKKKVII